MCFPYHYMPEAVKDVRERSDELDMRLGEIRPRGLIDGMIEKSGLDYNTKRRLFESLDHTRPEARRAVLRTVADFSREYRSHERRLNDLRRKGLQPDEQDLVVSGKLRDESVSASQNFFKQLSRVVDVQGGISQKNISSAVERTLEAAEKRAQNILGERGLQASEDNIRLAKRDIWLSDSESSLMGDAAVESIRTGIDVGRLLRPAIAAAYMERALKGKEKQDRGDFFARDMSDELGGQDGRQSTLKEEDFREASGVDLSKVMQDALVGVDVGGGSPEWGRISSRILGDPAVVNAARLGGSSAQLVMLSVALDVIDEHRNYGEDGRKRSVAQP
jgi:hypothetical protein